MSTRRAEILRELGLSPEWRLREAAREREYCHCSCACPAIRGRVGVGGPWPTASMCAPEAGNYASQR
jgi:hypothetical protein